MSDKLNSSFLFFLFWVFLVIFFGGHFFFHRARIGHSVEAQAERGNCAKEVERGSTLRRRQKGRRTR